MTTMTRRLRQSRPLRQLRRMGPPRWLAIAAATIVALNLTLAGASAHGPDPTLSGGPFGQNQDLRFRWRSGSEPTAAIKTAIRTAAADANASRASRAATFTYDAAGSNPIGYGVGATCGVNGLACFSRTVPTGFTMWLREQGHVFDWGTMKWCQAYVTPPNGCYDAEMIALDEFGHVEILDHHVNYANDTDYEDAIVQTFARAKLVVGWNMHAFGRCDVASLQYRYDVSSWASKYSTCLNLTTVLTLAASPTAIPIYGTTTLTAALRVADDASYLRLGGNPIAWRIVTLQRRAPGTTLWLTVGTMSNGSVPGTYLLSQRLTSDAEYRAVFKTPLDEGLVGNTSATVHVYVGWCNAAISRGGRSAVPCI